MQILNKILLFFAPVALLLGCHEPFRSSISNGGKKDLCLSIYSKNEEHPFIKECLNPNEKLALTQNINLFNYIEYEINGHKCKIFEKDILKIAKIQMHGSYGIVLNDCGDATP